MGMFSREYLANRITAIETQITDTEAAINAVTVGGVASYSLNTGQTQQSVTKHNLPGLNALLQSLYNQLATLEARRNGSGVSIQRAAG